MKQKFKSEKIPLRSSYGDNNVLLLQVQNCGTVFQLIRDKPTLTLNS